MRPAHTSHNERRLNYLADIDGLRALAVLAVVFYHLQIPGFDGGYVGVDIFFVISGFLISGLIRDHLEAASFRFSSFYANRVMRLLPAVLTTVGATTIVAALVIQPDTMANFARSAFAATLSAANFVFFFESGYWDASSDLKPLLHLWSLGVEEQFYLFWPTFMFFILLTSKQNYRLGLLLICFASFLACVVYTPINSAATFYLLPFRAWQFALGALTLELWRTRRFTDIDRRILRTVGLMFCGASIISFRETTAFPGWLAIFPSTGAALVLLGSQENSLSGVLGNALARWLGQVSYSMYLVHWPPIVLYKSYTLSDLTPSSQLGLAFLTLILTISLHYGVERKFYHRRTKIPVGWRGAASYTVLTAIIMAVALAGIAKWPDQFSFRPVVLSAEEIEGYKERRFLLPRTSCRIDELGNSERCPIPDTKSILFLGNSHEPDGFNIIAGALTEGFQNPAIRFGTTNGCTDLEATSIWATSTNGSCQKRLDALEKSLDSIAWGTVFFSALKPYSVNTLPLITILETLHRRQPDVSIVVLEDYITTKQTCSHLINQFGTAAACGRLANISHLPRLFEEATPLQERVASLADATVDKVSLMCGEKLPDSCSTQTPEGHPMSMDKHHLTSEFAIWIGQRLANTSPSWLLALQKNGEINQRERD